jgi:hypothetical protein
LLEANREEPEEDYRLQKLKEIFTSRQLTLVCDDVR